MAHLLISDSLAYAVGWALVHFIWQGAAVFAAVSVALAAFRNSGAKVHYGVACLSLLIMFLLPVVTAIRNLRTNGRGNISIERGVEPSSSTVTPQPAVGGSSPSASPKRAVDR